MLAFADPSCLDCAISLGRDSKPSKATLPYFEVTINSFAAKSSQRDGWTSLLACLTSVAYGGIHAIGWNFTFATQTEQLLWRVSCPLLAIMGIPMYKFICYIEGQERGSLVVNIKWAFSWIPDYFSYGHMFYGIFYVLLCILCSLCFIPYCAARAFLVVEAFISLRHVPMGVYQVVNWASYIPHI